MTQNDNIPKYCILLSEKHTYLIITSYPVPKLEYRTTNCIVVNGEKFQSHAKTLTMIGQCPMPMPNVRAVFHIPPCVKDSN